MPIMITGMSYGASLSLETKIALARGATLAGISTNTGEAPVTNDMLEQNERNSKRHRYRFFKLNT